MMSRPLVGLFFSAFSVSPAASFSATLLARPWMPLRDPVISQDRLAMRGLSYRPALNPKFRPFSSNKQVLKMATTELDFGIEIPVKAPNTGIFVQPRLFGHGMVIFMWYDRSRCLFLVCSCFCWEEGNLAKRQAFVASWRGEYSLIIQGF
jgi:hypothetical protein